MGLCLFNVFAEIRSSMLLCEMTGGSHVLGNICPCITMFTFHTNIAIAFTVLSNALFPLFRFCTKTERKISFFVKPSHYSGQK